MSNTDRIEELRNKYEENPRRYFAPLANEFRKAGDLAQAIAICREHLPRQPGHMSGFIVFGQTLFEAGSLDEARSVFEQALALDPENLIALKHLGDIARTKGEASVARRWYERVLDADPRNDDIALQLESLSTPTPVLAAPAFPDAIIRADAPPIEEALGVFATFDPSSYLEMNDAPSSGRSEERWEPQASDSPRPVHHEPIDLDFPDDPEPGVSDATGDEFEEGLMAPEWPDTTELVARIVTPVRSAIATSAAAAPDAIAAFGREAHDAVEAPYTEALREDNPVTPFLPVAETILEVDVQNFAAGVTNEDPAVHSRNDVDDRMPVELPVEFSAERDTPEVDTPELDTPEVDALEADTRELDAPELDTSELATPEHAWAEESYADIASELQDEIPPDGDNRETDFPEPEVDAVEVPAGAPFVTQTMAELLVSQGFIGRAIGVYEELVHRNAGNDAYAARLSELRIHETALSATEDPARTPLYNTPVRSTPLFVTAPYAAAHDQESPVRTARDRFAELARRRVPRRTPAHATAVAEDGSEGLASLFGTTQPTSPDELAARALADAFGPVQDTGQSLFDLSSVTAPTPLRALTARAITPLHTPAVIAPAEKLTVPPADIDYSFDRFFPDPAVASQSAQSMKASDGETLPPVNEDLTQFSAWLKGLNNP